ncbi:hypothetical protein QY76_03450 [Edwardsiella sp. EA181011]|nr:hypothetical protein QY76_03450 [Edwardsiella sp. EA181011]
MADVSLVKEMLQKAIKKVLRPVQKREAVAWLLAAYRIGLRQGCRLMMQCTVPVVWERVKSGNSGCPR